MIFVPTMRPAARRACRALACARIALALLAAATCGFAWASAGGIATPEILPATVAVGDTVDATFTMTNVAIGGVNQTENVAVSNMFLTPSCGEVGSTCPPAQADPGVFALSNPIPDPDSACGGRTFTIVLHDATTGEVEFQPSVPVVLGPSYVFNPGKAAQCIVNFKMTVLKLPTKDAGGGATGRQTITLARADFMGLTTGDTASGNGTDTTTVILSNNANLANLTLSAGTLSPPFASGTTGYSATVVSNSNLVQVTPTVADPAATVKVNGTTVASGTPSAPIPLGTGSNLISAVVTAPDGTTTRTYNILVNYMALSACTYSVSPLDLSNRAAAGGPASIVVTTQSGCPVTATSFQPWVSVGSITPSGGTTTVALQIGANGGPARATAIVVAGRLFLVTQLAP